MNILEVAHQYKGNYALKFNGRNKKYVNCKISYIPVRICEFPNKELLMVVVYGFGKEPMMLWTNLKSTESEAYPW